MKKMLARRQGKRREVRRRTDRTTTIGCGDLSSSRQPLVNARAKTVVRTRVREEERAREEERGRERERAREEERGRERAAKKAFGLSRQTVASCTSPVRTDALCAGLSTCRGRQFTTPSQVRSCIRTLEVYNLQCSTK
jgi:hypothetical protein